jgi:integrase
MTETGRVHIFRHTLAARLAAAGASPFDIMQVLGHQDVSTTMIYAHLNPASRAKAIKLLDRPKPEVATASENENDARIDGSR